MRLTRTSIYAIYGLSCLAKQPQGRLIPMSVIVRKTGLPAKHLSKIFRTLVRAALLRAVPGPKGGFAFAKPPRKISVLDVVNLLEGPLTHDSCALKQRPCSGVASCLVGSKLQNAEALTVRAFGRLSIASLAQESRPFGPSSHSDG
jgi:Rrf2 family protein